MVFNIINVKILKKNSFIFRKEMKVILVLYEVEK